MSSVVETSAINYTDSSTAVGMTRIKNPLFKILAQKSNRYLLDKNNYRTFAP